MKSPATTNSASRDGAVAGASALATVRDHLAHASAELGSLRVACEIAVAGSPDDASRDRARGELRRVERCVGLLGQLREACDG